MKNILPNFKSNEILVFESNTDGVHMLGMAKFANENLGAVWGMGEGLSGKTYAIPTKNMRSDKTSDYEIAGAITRFKNFAFKHPELVFYLTKIGSEAKDINMDWIRDQFKKVPENVIKPKGW